MRLKDLLDVYDNWDNDIVINDDDLKPILKGRIMDLYNDEKIDDFLDWDVVAFGFYDGEITVWIREDNHEYFV